MKGAMKIISGFLLIIAGLWSYLAWPVALKSLKNLFWLVVGNIGLLVIFIGLIFLIIGFTDLGE